MTRLEIDAETYLLYPLFAVGTMATLGIISTDILPAVNLGDVLVNIGGIEWTLGRLLALIALAAVVINRDEPLDFDGWGAIEVWVLYATVGLIVAPPFFPAFEGWITETPAAFVSFSVQSIGFVILTYVN